MSYRLVLLLALGFQSFNALAANDLDKWNSPEGRQVRTALKNKTTPTTTYKEKPNVVDAEYRSTSNGGKILHRIEHATTESGSKKGVTIEALKQVDKAAVAKKWANQIFKGGVRFTAGAVLIEVAMQEMLDGLDWIMDEGGKVKKPNTDTPWNDPSVPYYYETSGWTYSRSSSAPGSCSLVSAEFKKSTPSHQGLTYEVVNPNLVGTGAIGRCKNNGGSNTYQVRQVVNPLYNPASPPPENLEVPKEELQQKINNYLNTSNNTSKDLLIEEAYKPTGKGYIEWSDDPDSRVEIFGDTPDIAKRVYDSDNPVADGLTKETPKISDPTLIEGETTPNPNPESPTITDPVTGQPIPNPNYDPNHDSGSTTQTKIPEFCDYAAKLCDWLDWTQEDPQVDEQQEPQVPSDQGIFSRTFDFNFNFSGQCPPNYSFVMNTQYFGGQKTFDLSWLCMIFTFLGYPLVFLSHCLGFWIFYEVAARKEIKW
ncbi:hypothetical protein [Escherichia coli]|uniref:hypothetical protein n=1 Tax=Escherichia coli TaxID=562 RepID=UPI001FF69091|nr:hypothetical protein [Escherichia coli]